MQLTNEQQEQVIALCRELVATQSLAGSEGRAARVAEIWMRRLGYDEVFVDAYGSVVGRRHGHAPGPHLHFDGHLDVVPPTAVENWRYPPYAGVLAEGRIWGRGTTDMKGPDAAMICAAAFVQREAFAGTITVSASVGEEELEGQALAAILAQKPADYVIIGENSELKIGIAQKGRAGIHLSSRGVPAHSSRPEEGRNAVYSMLEALARIRALPAPQDDLLGPGNNELVEIISLPYPGTSIVPHACRVRFDRRLVRGETPETVLAPLQAAIADLEDVSIALMQVELACYTGAGLYGQDFHIAWETPRDAPLVRAAAHALERVGLPVDYFCARYCSNGSASVAMGMPTIILGPSSPALAHTVDEYIEVDELLRGAMAYQALILELLGNG